MITEEKDKYVKLYSENAAIRYKLEEKVSKLETRLKKKRPSNL